MAANSHSFMTAVHRRRPLTVDIGQAPVARVHGPSRTPLGKLFFSVSI